MMSDVIALINGAKEIAVLTHISEDADSIGSAMAFSAVMEGIGKKVDIYVSDKIEKRLAFLGDEYIVYSGNAKEYELCVCLDCGDLKRLGVREEIFKKAKKTANIDHHYTNPCYADANYVQGDASSTGEILYKLFCEMKLEINKRAALCLYVAIASDTGGFRYRNTTPDTMRAAAALMEKGIDHAGLCSLLFEKNEENVMNITGYFMQNIHKYKDGKICIVLSDDALLEKYAVSEKDIGEIVNIPRMLIGCEIAASVRGVGDKVKISLRSNGKYDVSKIAQRLGGGGHKMASGITLENCTPEAAEEKIVELCSGAMEI